MTPNRRAWLPQDFTALVAPVSALDPQTSKVPAKALGCLNVGMTDQRIGAGPASIGAVRRRIATGVAAALAAAVMVAGPASAAAPPGYTVTGIDVSNHQGTINWSNVAAGGAKFAYAKATEGVYFVDPYYNINYDGAKNNGLYVGAYHYARPDHTGGRAQADYFLDHARYVKDGRTLPPMLDIEWPWTGSGSPYPCYGLSQSQMVTWIRDFVTRVRERTGTSTLIYTNTNWWNPCTGSNASFGDNPLFIANYSGTPTPLPPGWSTFAFWQYSNSGSLPGDQDVFNGTIAQLAQLAGGSSGVEQSEFADVDGDGRGDLIGISGANNDLTAYRNQGWGSPNLIVGWDRRALVAGFGDASRTTFADIDGDGRADLIGISGANNDLTAYRNQGWNGASGVIVGWDRQALVSGFGELTGLKFADIDGDGRADLIAVTGVNNDITAYRNQGWGAASGVFVGWDRRALASGFGGPQQFDLADIDGDGRADLIGDSGVNHDLTAYRNQGWNSASGVIVGWDRRALVSGFGPLWPLKIVDLDGDRRADLIGISGVNNDMTAYRNQGWDATTGIIVGWDRNPVVSGFQP